MARTNVGDAVALTFEAISGISVTAQIIDPAGTLTAPVPVPADTDDDSHYTYTFIPNARGVWRVHFAGSGQAVASETYEVVVTDLSTGPAPYATSDTIETMWRPLSGEEAIRADTLCRYASQIVRTRIPSIDPRITAGKLDPDVAAFVCAQMVLRVMRNPSGVAAETVGPWSVTYGSSGTQATGALYLSDDDIALLTGLASGARSGYVRAVYSHNRFLPSRAGVRAWGAEA